MATEPTTGPITGEGGSLYVEGTEINDIRNWRVNRTCDVKEYNSNNTSGWGRTGKGNIRWEGSFEAYLQQGDMNEAPINFAEGDYLRVRLMTVKIDKYLEGMIRIGSIDAGVDIEGNEFEGYTVNFVGDGPYNFDAALPTPTPTPTGTPNLP
jgi:hypothetical protein